MGKVTHGRWSAPPKGPPHPSNCACENCIAEVRQHEPVCMCPRCAQLAFAGKLPAQKFRPARPPRYIGRSISLTQEQREFLAERGFGEVDEVTEIDNGFRPRMYVAACPSLRDVTGRSLPPGWTRTADGAVRGEPEKPAPDISGMSAMGFWAS